MAVGEVGDVDLLSWMPLGLLWERTRILVAGVLGGRRNSNATAGCRLGKKLSRFVRGRPFDRLCLAGVGESV